MTRLFARAARRISPMVLGIALGIAGLFAVPAIAQQFGGSGGFTGPIPAGTNNIGNVGVTGALPTGTNNIGNVGVTGALPAGTNLLGGTTPVPASTSGAPVPVTVGTSSTVAVAAGAKRILAFKNQSASATIGLCPASVTTPALNTAGCVDVPPGSFFAACSPGYCGSDAWNAIASAASTPLTVIAN